MTKMIARLLPLMPRALVGRFARPYMAGETVEHAVATVKALMEEGACATIDLLGEEVTCAEQTHAAVQEYRDVLDAIRDHRLDANVSLKPTQMGLKVDPGLCQANIRALVEHAASHRNFVCIDMEDSSCTDQTLAIFRALRRDHANVGTVLQACLRRTVADISALLPLGPNLRLCKGIYVEDRAIAFRDPELVNTNYLYALRKLLSAGAYVGIATHDERLLLGAMHRIDELGLAPHRYEFQMLLGVTPHLRRTVIAQGHRLRVYVPYGQQWFAYSARRLRENPAIVGHVMRDLVGRVGDGRRRPRALPPHHPARPGLLSASTDDPPRRSADD